MSIFSNFVLPKVERRARSTSLPTRQSAVNQVSINFESGVLRLSSDLHDRFASYPYVTLAVSNGQLALVFSKQSGPGFYKINSKVRSTNVLAILDSIMEQTGLTGDRVRFYTASPDFETSEILVDGQSFEVAAGVLTLLRERQPAVRAAKPVATGW